MKQLLLCTILCLCVMLSCSKKEQPPAGDCPRVGQVFEVFPGGAVAAQPFATLAYDDSARVKTVTGPGAERRVYSYYKDSIDVKTTYASGAVLRNTYFLNDEGRVVRSRSVDYGFRYDEEGCLVAFRQHNGKTGPDGRYIDYHVRWEGGNLVEVSSADAGAPIPPVLFNYYAQPHQELVGFNSPLWEGRVLGNWDLLYLVPGGYLGKAPRDLLKVALYEFDEKGRVVTMQDRWAFRYDCR